MVKETIDCEYVICTLVVGDKDKACVLVDVFASVDRDLYKRKPTAYLCPYVGRIVAEYAAASEKASSYCY